MRRASARNSCGKHRAALADLYRAQQAEPSKYEHLYKFFGFCTIHFNADIHSKQTRVEIQKTKELLRNAVNRAPFVKSHVVWFGEGSEENSLVGPDLR
jgi:hypothetical protein